MKIKTKQKNKTKIETKQKNKMKIKTKQKKNSQKDYTKTMSISRNCQNGVRLARPTHPVFFGGQSVEFSGGCFFLGGSLSDFLGGVFFLFFLFFFSFFCFFGFFFFFEKKNRKKNKNKTNERQISHQAANTDRGSQLFLFSPLEIVKWLPQPILVMDMSI